MKPRTKLEIEVFRLSKRLPNLDRKQKEWAYDKCLDHKGFATKSRVICMDCGKTFSPDLVNRKRAVCPHCETKLKIENTRKRTDHQVNFFAQAHVYGEYQIVRNFELIANYRKGKKVSFILTEILQYWIRPDGKNTMVGLLHHTQGYCNSWGGDWAIRKNYSRSIYNWNVLKYKIYPFKYTPDSEFKSEYKKYGIDYNLDGLTLTDAIKILPENPRAETLLKAKQYDLLFRCKDYPSDISYNWPSIKICLRNRYKIKDASLYIDYLDLLRYFNKDLRNAKYVCPKNFKKAHDTLVKKKQKIQERQRRMNQEEQKKKRIERDRTANIRYQKNKKPFIGLKFSKGKIQISFLNNTNEIKEEGEILHHCVYVNEYHDKNTLLFSALVDGVKTATVEVDTDLLQVVQVRGKYNNPTDYDDKIRKILEDNMFKIGEIVNASEKYNIAS
ncbi:PcfJ domain-containing protein [Mesonia aestuariivivens]|uniref:PcfJ domain-containing protein n=1 Tax=Mesonia aestuariivivens TaxID=2796128 RepID=A0ABS6W0C4_9FLAO|nr:PcfJ domain-containing protein [Mesonia aestuariivivens]MBW2961291.1 PcfJ domain-containing protein [Mesonia aestuariivivens]